MNASEKEPSDRTTGSEARRLAITLISAGACIGVAVIAAALFFLS
jgi:hypothetical protein